MPNQCRREKVCYLLQFYFRKYLVDACILLYILQNGSLGFKTLYNHLDFIIDAYAVVFDPLTALESPSQDAEI